MVLISWLQGCFPEKIEVVFCCLLEKDYDTNQDQARCASMDRLGIHPRTNLPEVRK